MSWDVVYIPRFSNTFVSKDLGFFHSFNCLYYFLQLQTSNNVFSQVDSAVFQVRVMLLKPGLQTSMWKLRQKGVTSSFPHGIKQCISVALLCLSFFT